MVAVSLTGVSKKYRIFQSKRDRLKEALSFGRKEYGHDFWALRDVNLEVKSGTTLGILGRNGAGKSTLLNIVAGILQPTSGTVEVNGRVVMLSGLGAGFNREFTGRENIMLNGLVLGIKRQEMLERLDDIAAFADVGEFMDQPLKTYSSGMRSRLGFAVAINVKPDILILDETLATGDAVYKRMALQKMYELRDSGTTILFVSHSTQMVEDFCTETLLLHEGRVMATGETTEVIGEYKALVASIREAKKQQQMDDGQSSNQAVATKEKRLEVPTFKKDPDFERRVAHLRSGTGAAKIQGVELLDERNHPVQVVTSGTRVTMRVYLEYMETVNDSELRVSIHDEPEPRQANSQENQFYGPNLGYVLELYERYREDPESVDGRTREFFETWSPSQVEANGHESDTHTRTWLYSASTALEGVQLTKMEKGERVVVDFALKVPLRRGRYGISVGVRASGEDSFLDWVDWVDIATTFRIKLPRDRKPFLGVVHLPTKVRVHTLEGERQGRPV
jgi:ABC-type polysaccharide/polyol phosphate transport system ATPase subunit